MDFKRYLKTSDVGFQMAPMVDVMFLMLTLYMAASVYSQWETKMGITVPTADTGVTAPRMPGEIIINLDEEGKIFVNDVEMEPSRLEELLRQVATTFREQPVIIRADAKTRHEKVMQVLDLCRRVDIWNVAFATLPPKQE